VPCSASVPGAHEPETRLGIEPRGIAADARRPLSRARRTVAGLRRQLRDSESRITALGLALEAGLALKDEVRPGLDGQHYQLRANANVSRPQPGERIDASAR